MRPSVKILAWRDLQTLPLKLSCAVNSSHLRTDRFHLPLFDEFFFDKEKDC